MAPWLNRIDYAVLENAALILLAGRNIQSVSPSKSRISDATQKPTATPMTFFTEIPLFTAAIGFSIFQFSCARFGRFFFTPLLSSKPRKLNSGLFAQLRFWAGYWQKNLRDGGNGILGTDFPEHVPTVKTDR